MDLMTFLFGDGFFQLAVADPISSAIALGTSAALSFVASRQARKEADKLRRKARESEGREIEITDDDMQRAIQQELLFSDAIRNTTNFFRDVSPQDIASGKVASPRSEPVINAINRSAENQITTLDRSLARRGIGDDAVAQTERGEIEQNRGTLIAEEKARALDQNIEDNFRLTELGLGARRETRLSTLASQSAQRAKTNRLSGLAENRLALAGAGGSGSVAATTSLIKSKFKF